MALTESVTQLHPLLEAIASKLQGYMAPAIKTWHRQYKVLALVPTEKDGKTAYPLAGKLVVWDDLEVELEAANLYHFILHKDLLELASALRKGKTSLAAVDETDLPAAPGGGPWLQTCHDADWVYKLLEFVQAVVKFASGLV